MLGDGCTRFDRGSTVHKHLLCQTRFDSIRQSCQTVYSTVVRQWFDSGSTVFDSFDSFDSQGSVQIKLSAVSPRRWAQIGGLGPGRDLAEAGSLGPFGGPGGEGGVR